MVTTVAKIEGMMCPRCEAHVREAIEKRFAPQSVTASREAGEAVIVSETPVDADALAAVVNEAGYRFISVKTE